MFVTTGIGTSILPVRFLTPPVIDVLEIRAAQ
jgi:predicted MPP superfamily phosphohydrolase